MKILYEYKIKKSFDFLKVENKTLINLIEKNIFNNG